MFIFESNSKMKILVMVLGFSCANVSGMKEVESSCSATIASLDYDKSADIANFKSGTWYEIGQTRRPENIEDCAVVLKTVINSTALTEQIKYLFEDGTERDVWIVLISNGAGESFYTNSTWENIILQKTDYESYYIVWACNDINSTHSQQSWYILSNSPVLSDDAQSEVDSYLNANNISSEEFDWLPSYGCHNHGIGSDEIYFCEASPEESYSGCSKKREY